MKNTTNLARMGVYNKVLVLGVRRFLDFKGVKFPFLLVIRNAP